jgi:AcrR family transcriptional regulator
MARKNARNTRGRIISAAWKLFYQQGYENTTVEDIVFESATSKGSFYHYFDGKDALLGTLAYVFDEKYQDLSGPLQQVDGAVEKLIFLNHELFAMIDGGVSIDLLTRLLSTQLLARGKSTCWTGTGSISGCCGASRRRAWPPGPSAPTSTPTPW